MSYFPLLQFFGIVFETSRHNSMLYVIIMINLPIFSTLLVIFSTYPSLYKTSQLVTFLWSSYRTLLSLYQSYENVSFQEPCWLCIRAAKLSKILLSLYHNYETVGFLATMGGSLFSMNLWKLTSYMLTHSSYTYFKPQGGSPILKGSRGLMLQ